MKINEASQKSGIAVDTMRYYEKLGLLKPGRHEGKRLYSLHDLQRLQQIQLLKDATFTLKEIKYFVELDEKLEDMQAIQRMKDQDYDNLMHLVETKSEVITEKVESLKKAQSMVEKMHDKLKSLERVNGYHSNYCHYIQSIHFSGHSK